jgi:hypothetical protein
MSSVRPMQHAGTCAATFARSRADLDVIACSESQQRRRPVLEVRQHELAGRAVPQADLGARPGVDQLGVDEAARAEVHPILLLALAP